MLTYFGLTGLACGSARLNHFEGVRPRVDVCVTRGPPVGNGAPRAAALHGLWYVTVAKEGTLHAETNYTSWQDYKPAVAWLAGLWGKHKLSHDAYLKKSALFRTGHSKRKRDVEDILREDKKRAVEERVERELQACDVH